jgi:DNA processing protein
MNLAEEIQAGMALNLIEGLGPIRLHQLIREFGSAVAALTQGPLSWAEHIGDGAFCEKLKPEIVRIKEEVKREWERCEKMGVRILCSTAGPYPALLKEIHVPPPILYVKGKVAIEECEGIAVVGSRRCSYYGARAARRLSRELSEVGLVTVSGLARGIDSAVHEETLAAGGITIAVIGSGLDVYYPPENRVLCDRIAADGAIVTEFPLGTRPLPGNFPRRNRIIAGLTRGTVVVEGTLKSGSLITAKIAANEGRDVFAVPGPVTSGLSEAAHLLIREGAALVRGAADIVDALPPEVCAQLRSTSFGSWVHNDEAAGPVGAILKHLESEALNRETLIERVGLSAEQAGEILIRLELEGRIKSMPGGVLVRV